MDQRPPTRQSPRPGSVLYVVPTLGQRADYLAQTLDSLESQEHPSVTVVLVAPSAAEHVRAEAATRHHQFVAQSSTGMSAAINEGWRAYGDDHEFWAWIGDDDTLTPGSTQRAVERLTAEPGASMVYGQCQYVDQDGGNLFVVRPTALASRLMRWGPNLVPQPGSMARAAAVRQVGLLDESLRYAMDLDLFLRLQDAGPVRYLPEALATFRWHPASTTVASSAASEAEARAVRARTWTGRRSLGRAGEPLAMLAGRVLHKVQRVPQSSLR